RRSDVCDLCDARYGGDGLAKQSKPVPPFALTGRGMIQQDEWRRMHAFYPVARRRRCVPNEFGKEENRRYTDGGRKTGRREGRHDSRSIALGRARTICVLGSTCERCIQCHIEQETEHT